MPQNEPDLIVIENSLLGVIRWVEDHRYKAYDPGDGDLSFLRHLTFNRKVLKRVLTASVLRFPFHIRPWIGVRPHTSTKGIGYMLWGYAKMYARTGDPLYRDRADTCYEWLRTNTCPGYSNPCWGNHFDFTTRGGTMPAFTPTIVWSSLIGLALVEAYEIFAEQKYLNMAAGIAEWIKTLPVEATTSGLCLSYVPYSQSSIHNSNLLGASLLAKVGNLTKDEESSELARAAVTYTCTRQNADGSWYYGEAPKYHWIDSFHTGYNLDSLKRYMDATGDRTFESHLRNGLRYFKRIFLEKDGAVRYYHHKRFPIDIQCTAQAIDTLTLFANDDPEALGLAVRTGKWTISKMQDREGHFYYRDLGWIMIKTPMLHWGQGTMFKALAALANEMAASSQARPDLTRTKPRPLA